MNVRREALVYHHLVFLDPGLGHDDLFQFVKHEDDRQQPE